MARKTYPDSFEALVPGGWTGGLKALLLSRGHVDASAHYDKMAASLLPALRAEVVSLSNRRNYFTAYVYKVHVKKLSSRNTVCTVSRYTKSTLTSLHSKKSTLTGLHSSTGLWLRKAKLAWHKKRTSPNSSLFYWRGYVCVISKRLHSKKTLKDHHRIRRHNELKGLLGAGIYALGHDRKSTMWNSLQSDLNSNVAYQFMTSLERNVEASISEHIKKVNLH